MTGGTLQLAVLVKMQTSLNLFIFKESELQDQVPIEKVQNTLGKIMVHMTMNARWVKLIIFNQPGKFEMKGINHHLSA